MATSKEKKEDIKEGEVPSKTENDTLKECIETLQKGIDSYISKSELMELKTKLEGLTK